MGAFQLGGSSPSLDDYRVGANIPSARFFRDKYFQINAFYFKLT